MKCSLTTVNFVLTICLMVCSTKAYGCELSWSRFGDNCYRIYDQKVTRVTARLRCFMEGSDLVSIPSTSILDFLAEHTAHSPHSKFWVGLERKQPGDEFAWFDGTDDVKNQSWVRIPEANTTVDIYDQLIECFAYDGALVVKEHCYESYAYICGHHVSTKKKNTDCKLFVESEHTFVGDATGHCLFRVPYQMSKGAAEGSCQAYNAHFVDFNSLMRDGLTAFYNNKVLSNDGSKYWTNFTFNGSSLVWNIEGIGDKQYDIPVIKGNGSCITVQFNFTESLSTHFYQTDCNKVAYVVCFVDNSLLDASSTTTRRAIIEMEMMEEPGATCPEGYNWKTDRSKNYCYWETSFETDQLSWDDAEKYCQSYGGHLGSFHSIEEEKLGLSFQYGSLAHDYWIGLSLNPVKGTYSWSDGSPLDYTNWAPGHPDHKDKILRCVSMHAQDKFWTSSLCGILSWFICKVPKRTYHPAVYSPTPTSLESCENNPFVTKSSWYFQGACYFPVIEALSWHRSKQYCENQGGSLVSIHSTEEIGFLLRLLQDSAMETNRVWIGLNSFGSDGSFRWTDWTAVDFTYFASDEPNNYQNQEKCCNMNSRNGQWNDENCNAALGFVCKIINDTSVSAIIPTTMDPRIGNCKKGWIPHLDRCYYIGGKREKDQANWTEAVEFCQKNGGYLTSIRDSVDQNFLAYLLQVLGDDAWIGLHDTIQSGRYYWLDNSDVQYTNWAPGEPSFFGIMEDCVKMVYDHLDSGVWKDDECHRKIGYICQSNKDPKLPPPPSDRGMNCVHPEGWLKMDTMCFKMFEGSPITWDKAELACQKEGGHLVSVSDQKVKAVVTYLATEVNQPFFIGLKYDKDSQTVRWLNNFPVRLTNWEKNEPSRMTDDDGTCFASTSEGYWKKASCDEKMPYACQITTGKPRKLRQFEGECPPSSNLWVPGSYSYCYILNYEHRMDWFTANLMCFRYGSHLISIHSKEEIEDMKKFIKPGVRSVYLGLMRNKKGGFTWTDDTPMDFQNWDEEEPSNSEDQCVEMVTHNMKWRVTSCLSKKHFTCMDTKGTLVLDDIQADSWAAEQGGLSTAGICAVVFSILIGVILIAAAVVYRRRFSNINQFRRQDRNSSVSFENALYNVGSTSMAFNDETKS